MINPIWRGRFAIGEVLIPLRRSDPVVALIHAAMILCRAIRELADARSHDPKRGKNPPLDIPASRGP